MPQTSSAPHAPHVGTAHLQHSFAIKARAHWISSGLFYCLSFAEYLASRYPRKSHQHHDVDYHYTECNCITQLTHSTTLISCSFMLCICIKHNMIIHHLQHSCNCIRMQSMRLMHILMHCFRICFCGMRSICEAWPLPTSFAKNTENDFYYSAIFTIVAKIALVLGGFLSAKRSFLSLRRLRCAIL